MPNFDNQLNNSAGDPRPTTFWNNDISSSLSRNASPPHEHEFGVGYDILYKDANGNVQARMDGLTPIEMEVLKSKIDT